MTVVTFTGTRALTRFTIRRDRVRIAVWVGLIVVLVVSTVASVKGLYPTQSDLDVAARASEDNAAAIIFNGPPLALDTVGGQVAFQTGTFGLVVMGLMSVFVLGRLTRGEEEAGRAELLRSLPVGPNALPAAALITVAGMNVATGAVVITAMLVLGLPTAGSIAFGLSFALFGLLLASVTAVAAQVTENTRVVYGVGCLVIGMSFVLRAIGDVGDGTVSWLSPIGWAQKTRPFAHERWWPFLVIVATTIALARTAITLAHRRDLGAGLVPPRAGPARAGALLRSSWGLALRLQRASAAGWSLAVAVLAVAYGSIADSINDFVEDNEALADIIAAQGGGTLVDQYQAMSARILALIAAGFAIQSVGRIRGEETTNRAEYLLATPLSRLRFAASHLVVAFVGTVAILFAAGLTFGVADGAVTGDQDAIAVGIVSIVSFAPAVWILAALAAATIGVAPRAWMGVWLVLGLCFVIGMFSQLLGLPRGIEDLSPFQHVPRYPAENLDAVPLVALVVATAALTGVGLLGFRRRDLDTR